MSSSNAKATVVSCGTVITHGFLLLNYTGTQSLLSCIYLFIYINIIIIIIIITLINIITEDRKTRVTPHATLCNHNDESFVKL